MSALPLTIRNRDDDVLHQHTLSDNSNATSTFATIAPTPSKCAVALSTAPTHTAQQLNLQVRVSGVAVDSADALVSSKLASSSRPFSNLVRSQSSELFAPTGFSTASLALARSCDARSDKPTPALSLNVRCPSASMSKLSPNPFSGSLLKPITESSSSHNPYLPHSANRSLLPATLPPTLAPRPPARASTTSIGAPTSTIVSSGSHPHNVWEASAVGENRGSVALPSPASQPNHISEPAPTVLSVPKAAVWSAFWKSAELSSSKRSDASAAPAPARKKSRR